MSPKLLSIIVFQCCPTAERITIYLDKHPYKIRLFQNNFALVRNSLNLRRFVVC